jgi:N-acetylmuramoyl-L-alanine amidase
MKIDNFYSPNFDKKRRSSKSIKLIIIHYTGMQSERESIKRLCDPNSKVSSHFLINQKGKILRLVKDNKIAWHAGKSSWGGFKNLNKNSIGIELVNRGHQYGYTYFKKKQIVSLIKICKILIKKYKIKSKNVIGHSDVAPLRKIDPGEKFPWKILSAKQIGIWHHYNLKFLKKYRNKKIFDKDKNIKFVKNLNKIGYCIYTKKYLIMKKVISAFQRHFRKELINGRIDKECLIISQSLVKNL